MLMIRSGVASGVVGSLTGYADNYWDGHLRTVVNPSRPTPEQLALAKDRQLPLLSELTLVVSLVKRWIQMPLLVQAT
jgi:hypothetical protein